MKRVLILFAVVCLLLAGCTNGQKEVAESTAPAESIVSAENAATEAVEQTETAATEMVVEGKKIFPLPDTTMDNLSDAIVAVSLEADDAYVDDTGAMQMDLKIYSYDKFDMVDIAALEVGDIIVRYSGEVVVTSKEQNEAGIISINGGVEAGGFDLATEDSGIFYEVGLNDAKNWYEAGVATIPVSADFEFVDNADQEQGEIIFYPGSFLTEEITNYDFTPNNTTIRVEEGKIVEMNRIFVP